MISLSHLEVSCHSPEFDDRKEILSIVLPKYTILYRNCPQEKLIVSQLMDLLSFSENSNAAFQASRDKVSKVVMAKIDAKKMALESSGKISALEAMSELEQKLEEETGKAIKEDQVGFDYEYEYAFRQIFTLEATNDLGLAP
ncbi:hypothetical protein AKJ16_DCAP25812, partial [Drosera capensis]